MFKTMNKLGKYIIPLIVLLLEYNSVKAQLGITTNYIENPTTVDACNNQSTYHLVNAGPDDCDWRNYLLFPGDNPHPDDFLVVKNSNPAFGYYIEFSISVPGAANSIDIIPKPSCKNECSVVINWNPNFVGRAVLRKQEFNYILGNKGAASTSLTDLNYYCVHVCGNAGISMSPSVNEIIGSGTRTLSITPRKGNIQWYAKTPQTNGQFWLLVGQTDFDYEVLLNEPGTYEYYATQTLNGCDSRNSVTQQIIVKPTCVLSSVDGANNTTSIISSNSEGANAALYGTGILNIINNGYSNIAWNSNTGVFESKGGYEVKKDIPFNLNLKGVTDFNQHYDVVFNSATDIQPSTFVNNSSYTVTSALGSYRFSFVKKSDGVDRSECPNIPELKLFVGGADAIVPPSKCLITIPAYFCQGTPQNLPGANCLTDIIFKNFKYTVISQTGIIIEPGIILAEGADLKIEEVEVKPDKFILDNQKNWTELTVFDDYGNTIGASRNYFDVMGRPMQAQVKNISAGVVLASQSLYDQYGRASLSTLTAPVASLILATTDNNGCALSRTDRIPFEHKPDFISTVSGMAYTYKNFDGTFSTSKEFTPDPIKKDVPGTLGWYYSNNNVNSATTSMKEPLVAKTDYPFAKTEFYNDGTQEVKRSVSPGNVYRSTSNYQHVTTGQVVAITSTDPDITKWLQMRADAFPNAVQPTSLLDNAIKTKIIDQQGVQTYTISDKSDKEIIRVHIDPSSGAKTYSFDFYDDAGRLKYSVTPNGVAAYFGSPSTPFSNIDKASYEFNHRGWLLATNETDAGRTEYKYRKDGMLRFSQNAEQRNASPERYSYTNYDLLNRSVESGEYIIEVNGITWSAITTSILESRNVDGGLPVGTKIEVVKTYYDGENGSNISPYTQDFVMGKVSCIAKNGDTRTWYSYDERGRIIWSAQELPSIGIKKTEYIYDQNGSVKEIAYQRGQANEEFYHVYEYDEDCRLKKVQTSTVTPIYSAGLITNGTEQAEYKYYLHGPLKRVELANDLQGIDYLYTVEGWLKSINSEDKTTDPGMDGNDVFGISLLHYNGDFSKSGVQVTNPLIGTSMYNGNIGASLWHSDKPSGGGDAFASYSYEYDSKYQLINAQWSTINNNVLTSLGAIYKEGNISYDRNGNINALQRFDNTGLISSSQNFSYNYLPNTNQLASVANVGNSPTTDYASYQYNAIGQLKSTTKGSFTSYAHHNVKGFMTSISKDPDGTDNVVKYYYSDGGLRYRKQTYNNSGTLLYETFYVHDALGNTLAVYDNNNVQSLFQKTETYIYGIERLGMFDGNQYAYQLKDHLGSIRATIRKNNGILDILSYMDYYPYGMVLRKAGTIQRYGYQGNFAEADQETGFNSFELRMYDPAIGKWLSVDPKREDFSPYIGMDNNPVNKTDPDGGGTHDVIDLNTSTGEIKRTPDGSNINKYYVDGKFAGWAEDGKGGMIFNYDNPLSPKPETFGQFNFTPFANYYSKPSKFFSVSSNHDYFEGNADGCNTGFCMIGLGLYGLRGGLLAKGLPRSGPIMKSLGSASRAEMLARKLKMNIQSPTTRQVLNSLDDTVESFISKYRTPSIRSKLPGEFLNLTVEEALRSGNTTVRKLLIDSRFVK
jgi:RHS repeat-associated protein